MRRSPGCRPIAIALSALVASGLVAPATAHAQQAPAAAATDDTAEVCFSAAERAQPLLRQKKLREARAVLELCSREACPRVARTDCREWLAEATDAQPSIVIAAHEIRGDEPPRDVGGVRAVIDDALVVDRVDATPIVIDPGHHRLRLERAGVDPIFQDIDIRDGEKGRVVDVYWRVSAAVVPTRPVPASVFLSGAVGIFAVGLGTYFENLGALAAPQPRHVVQADGDVHGLAGQRRPDSASRRRRGRGRGPPFSRDRGGSLSDATGDPAGARARPERMDHGGARRLRRRRPREPLAAKPTASWANHVRGGRAMRSEPPKRESGGQEDGKTVGRREGFVDCSGRSSAQHRGAPPSGPGACLPVFLWISPGRAISSGTCKRGTY